MHETTELAVMCDTFHPLKLTKFAKDLDDGKYAYSWYENAPDVAGQRPRQTATPQGPVSPPTFSGGAAERRFA
jgi:hypothetical protein